MTQEKQKIDQEMEEKKLEKPVALEKDKIEDIKQIKDSTQKAEVVKEEKIDDKKVEDKKEIEKKAEEKIEVKKEEVSKGKASSTAKAVEGPKKTEAVVNGRDLRISTKHAVAVCNFIRNKNVDNAISLLDEVTNYKRAIPMRGEIPHRKGMMSGRYPIKAVGEFIKLLKSVKANAVNNELELEKVKIFCVPNVASSPRSRFGQKRHKRSHVQIKLIPNKK